MFSTGFVGLSIVTGAPDIPLAKMKSEAFTTFSSYSLSIVPMFLLMGHFATLGGMSQALFKAAELSSPKEGNFSKRWIFNFGSIS